MFNIPDDIIIKNLKKIGCKKAHIAHCLSDRNMHEKPQYTYFGKIVSRGTVLLHTCRGDCVLKFYEKNGWARELEII